MRSLARFLAVPLVLGWAVSVAPDAHLLAQTASTTEQDFLLGTWQLDLSKSKYIPGPAPRGETRTYARDNEGLKGTIRRRLADGREEVIEYRADFDHEYPVAGTEAYDTIKLTRIDARTAQAVLSHAGREFGTARRVVSDDGQTLTIEFRREGNTAINNVAVYRKQTQ